MNAPDTHGHAEFAEKSDSSVRMSDARSTAATSTITKKGPRTRANNRVLSWTGCDMFMCDLHPDGSAHRVRTVRPASPIRALDSVPGKGRKSQGCRASGTQSLRLTSPAQSTDRVPRTVLN
ncbi:hypothetical protein GCM10027535_05840 [Mycolicibacterium hippocampi]|uniref:Uncharacterized protein n=1 Tax=Mycolicibacterium hippocampi TaxID=659824 RepID=A0A7I9ZKB6_9MYCO|nr:hypothetical protein MHIP_19430 [Mycolicibacterium hippocampi]